MKRQRSVLDDGIDSVGPIRRIRLKSGLSSERFKAPAGRDSSGVMANNHSIDAGSVTSDAVIKSVPSQSSEVAKKIFQQLDKVSPSPKENLSEHRSMRLQRGTPFTLTPDILTGQALRSLEDIDTSKFTESFQENSRLNESVQRLTTIEDYKSVNGKNQVEENVPKNMTSFSNTDSKTAFTHLIVLLPKINGLSR